MNGLERATISKPKAGTWWIVLTVFGKIEDDAEASGGKSAKTDRFRVQVFLK